MINMASAAVERLQFDESKAGVKGLSDAGISSIPGFFVHPPEVLSSLNSSVSLSIPVIDLSGLHSPDRRMEIVDEIKSAASTWGFFQVVNHGMPEAMLDRITTAVKAFHDLPPEAKQEHYTRGEREAFSYMTNVDLYGSNAASWSDHVQVSMSPEAQTATIPEMCRSEVVEWDAHVTKVGESVVELLAEGLGLGSRRFLEPTCVDGRMFGGICYPYCPQADLTVGLTSHTDPWMIAALLPNQVPGLQVKHGDDWVDVLPVPGGLIINVGDLLQMMSNDVYKSVQHRVRANTSSEPRISVVMFFTIGKYREKDEFGPLPELVSPENPPKYRNFTFEDYMDSFYGKKMGNKAVAEIFKIKNSA